MNYQLVLFCAVFVLIAVVVLYGMTVVSRRDGAWIQFAASRQLAWAKGQIAGVVNGCTVAMILEERGHGRQKRTVALVRCSLPEVFGASFGLERETMFEKLKHLVGEPDHQVGDPELDSTFLLTNVDGGARRVLSDKAARTALLECVDRYPAMRIGNSVVQLELSTVPSTEAELSRFLNDAVKLSTTLQRAKQRA